MRNYKINGIGKVVELGDGGFVIDTSNDTDFAILNTNDDLINIRSASPTIPSHLATKEYVDSLLSATPLNIFNVVVGQSDLVLADITEFTKVEVEYGFTLDSIDSIQVGKITVLYDGIDAICTSHEIEESGNLADIQGVEFDAYLDGNNFGIRFDNSIEAFDFQYYYVNKFNISYTPNLSRILTSNLGPSTTSFSFSNELERFGQTFTPTESGLLTRIGLCICRLPSGLVLNGSMNLKVYDAPNGNLLATSDNVLASSLTDFAPISGFSDLTDFIFTNGVVLNTSLYYFELDATLTTGKQSTLSVHQTNSIDQYPTGVMYYDSNQAGNIGPYIANSDLIFDIQAD